MTLYDEEITFYSKDFYLGVSKDKKSVCGEVFMKKWKFIKKGDKYSFYLEEEDNKNILTESDNVAKIKGEKKKEENQQFRLIEIVGSL